VFLIMFKTGHALLLPGGRFLSPRTGRDKGVEPPRTITNSWPQTRRFHEHEQARYRTRIETARVHEQSAPAFNSRQRAGQQTARIHELTSASIVRKLASARSTRFPQTVRGLELSASTASSQFGIFHDDIQAEDRLRHRIAVSISVPVSFPVHIQNIPVYGHV